jgi:hypothetical protein
VEQQLLYLLQALTQELLVLVVEEVVINALLIIELRTQLVEKVVVMI